MTKQTRGLPASQPGESLLSQDDLYLFNEGSHFRLWEKLGAHPQSRAGEDGAHFAVWAPDAEKVTVIGDFNGWDRDAHPLYPQGSSGVWQGFVPGALKGQLYKYHIRSRFKGYRADKADPFALATETPPAMSSRVWDLDYEWGDGDWMAQRAGRNALSAPISIYEVHLGSWMRAPADGGSVPLTYRDLAPRLAEYCARMGFSHVEFLPVMEHPFYGSWGYQVTGFFAPTSRYGSPQDFMYLIDTLHQAGLGVILDWVPSHFPTDEAGLGFFDGTHLFEHADPRQGIHRDWQSFIFNYGRTEVQSFLISSALFWLEVYHADGLRVDAVASMLYLDYSREEGDWVPNKYGGRENLEAIDFLRRMNTAIYERHPDVQTIAEESTAWPMVSRPTYVGGLGFGLKWDMGWMHDTLRYMAHEPIHRSFHHNGLTFRMLYAFQENFVLPLSHDEVVHGKGSLLGKMPGDEWQRFANLRLLLGYMFAQPGKKLLFMGGEIGQFNEWYHETSLDWHLLDNPLNAGVNAWVRDLNHFYRQTPALHARDCTPEGFAWVDCNDTQASVVSLLRKGGGEKELALIVCNFTPVVRSGYLVGAPIGGFWREALNSDAEAYGGSGQGNLGGVAALGQGAHGLPHSLSVTLPPLGMLCLVPGEPPA